LHDAVTKQSLYEASSIWNEYPKGHMLATISGDVTLHVLYGGASLFKNGEKPRDIETL
jgi:hypothetical protein